MSKMNKKSINKNNFSALQILTILAFGLIFMPGFTMAYEYSDAGMNVKYGAYSEDEYIPSIPPESYSYAEANNPKPSVYSISPKSADRNVQNGTITITGKGFVPGSVAKINGANRPTTFIDSSHLLLAVNGSDMYRTDGGFYVTVSNPAPGGGFSNAEFFKVDNTPFANPNPAGSYQQNQNVPQDFNALTSNALYGGNTFLPSGIIQWILLAIIVLILVILARKFFGGEEAYHAAPLKHD